MAETTPTKVTIAIDPVTRIEGHLKVEVIVEDGKVTDAKISGGMYRGFEGILNGRAPRDAIQIVQRICGCSATDPAPSSGMNGYRAVWSIELDSVGTVRYESFFLWDVSHRAGRTMPDVVNRNIESARVVVLLVPPGTGPRCGRRSRGTRAASPSRSASSSPSPAATAPRPGPRRPVSAL